MMMEAILAWRTDLLLFESGYIADRFESLVGKPRHLAHVVRNGIAPRELEPVTPDADAADLLYVGEFRSAKGLDTLIDALGLLAKTARRRPSLVLVGDGPERAALSARAETLGVASQLNFRAPMAAREAFAAGRILVVPSRAESLPYIVLEAAGAHKPIIATRVGGMAEIFGPYSGGLIPCDNPGVLRDALARMLDETPQESSAKTRKLADYVGARFSLSGMVDGVISRISRSHRAAGAIMTDASATRTNPAPSLVFDYQKLVNAAVWIFVLSGAISLVEPSPYDFASMIAIPLWFLGGFTLQRSFLLFAFLIISYTILGFLALIPYWSVADSAMYQYQSAYLTLTALVFRAVRRGPHGRTRGNDPFRLHRRHSDRRDLRAARLFRRRRTWRNLLKMGACFRHLQGSQRARLLSDPGRALSFSKPDVRPRASCRHDGHHAGDHRRRGLSVFLARLVGSDDRLHGADGVQRFRDDQERGLEAPHYGLGAGRDHDRRSGRSSAFVDGVDARLLPAARLGHAGI